MIMRRGIVALVLWLVLLTLFFGSVRVTGSHNDDNSVELIPLTTNRACSTLLTRGYVHNNTNETATASTLVVLNGALIPGQMLAERVQHAMRMQKWKFRVHGTEEIQVPRDWAEEGWDLVSHRLSVGVLGHSCAGWRVTADACQNGEALPPLFAAGYPLQLTPHATPVLVAVVHAPEQLFDAEVARFYQKFRSNSDNEISLDEFRSQVLLGTAFATPTGKALRNPMSRALFHRYDSDASPYLPQEREAMAAALSGDVYRSVLVTASHGELMRSVCVAAWELGVRRVGCAARLEAVVSEFHSRAAAKRTSEERDLFLAYAERHFRHDEIIFQLASELVKQRSVDFHSKRPTNDWFFGKVRSNFRVQAPYACRQPYFDRYGAFVDEMVAGTPIVYLRDPKPTSWTVGKVVQRKTIPDEEEGGAPRFVAYVAFGKTVAPISIHDLRPWHDVLMQDVMDETGCVTWAEGVATYQVHANDTFGTSGMAHVLKVHGKRFTGTNALIYEMPPKRMNFSQCRAPVPVASEVRKQCREAPFLDKSCLQPGQYRDEDMFYARYNYRCGTNGSMWSDANYFHSVCDRPGVDLDAEEPLPQDSCFGARIDGSVERCHKGPPPPGSTVLWLGNSHLRQLVEAAMVYHLENIHSVQHTEVKISPFKNATLLFADVAIDCEVHWSRREHCSTDIAVITWKNGAKWFVTANNPLNLLSTRGARPGFSAILRFFGLDNGKGLDAVYMNSGNGDQVIFQLKKTVSTDEFAEFELLQTLSQQNPAYSQERAMQLSRGYDLISILAELSTMDWHGHVYIMEKDSRDLRIFRMRQFAAYMSRVNEVGPFHVKYMSMDAVGHDKFITGSTDFDDYWRVRGAFYNVHKARDLIAMADKLNPTDPEVKKLRLQAQAITFMPNTHTCLFTVPLERVQVFIAELHKDLSST